MKKRNITKLALAALIALAFTSCVPDIDLAGHAWTSNTYCFDGGERVDTEFALVCTSTNSGTLFISQTYAGEDMGICFAMPFTYTWDDNQGTATATLEFPEDLKGRKSMSKGTYTFKINMYYTKTEGMVVTSSDIERVLEIPCTSMALTKNDFAKPSAMTGTRWSVEFDEAIDAPDDMSMTAHYRYELEFVSTTAAVLNLNYTEDGGDAENMNWNVNYTYADGVGLTSISFYGETVKGGFYMPDDTHMTFTDGENRLNLVKQSK